MEKTPSQQSLSYAWKQFSEQTKQTLNAAAAGIAQEAVDRGVILEARVPIIPDEDEINEDGDELTVTREHVRKQGNKIVELARRHAFGEFDSGRADNRVRSSRPVVTSSSEEFVSCC